MAKSSWLARLWPAALFAVAITLMILDARSDPFDPTLAGTRRYGHNHAGALAQMATWASVELVLLYLVLAPGSASRSVWRAVLALLGFAGWTLFSLALSMHAGGIVAVHSLWLLTVVLAILATLIIRIVTRRR
jgi:hypothetical protein